MYVSGSVDTGESKPLGAFLYISSLIVAALEDPSKTRKCEVATREMEYHQPCGNTIDQVVEEVGV